MYYKSVLINEPVHYQDTNYFRRLFQGRINRRNYILGKMLLMSIAVVVTALYNALYASFYLLELSVFFIGIIIIMIGAGLLLSISLDIRRLHDLGNSGWWFLLMYVPLANIPLSLLLLFQAGGGKPNKYGRVPSQSICFPADILSLPPSPKTGVILSKTAEKILFTSMGILFLYLVLPTAIANLSRIFTI
jgi:uncharacterized membrane protein YhaH (DUF805 family)